MVCGSGDGHVRCCMARLGAVCHRLSLGTPVSKAPGVPQPWRLPSMGCWLSAAASTDEGSLLKPALRPQAVLAQRLLERHH